MFKTFHRIQQVHMGPGPGGGTWPHVEAASKEETLFTPNRFSNRGSGITPSHAQLRSAILFFYSLTRLCLEDSYSTT